MKISIPVAAAVVAEPLDGPVALTGAIAGISLGPQIGKVTDVEVSDDVVVFTIEPHDGVKVTKG